MDSLTLYSANMWGTENPEPAQKDAQADTEIARVSEWSHTWDTIFTDKTLKVAN